MPESMASAALLARLPFGQIIDAISDFVCIIEADGTLAYVNKPWRGLLARHEDTRSPGARPGEVAAAVGPLESMRRCGLRTLRGDVVRDEEALISFAGGRRIWLRTTSYPIFDDDSRIVGAVVISRDVTEPHLPNPEPELQQLTLQTIFAHSPIGLLVVSVPHWTILDHNPAVLRMIPATLREASPLVGQAVESMVDGATFASLAAIFRQAITSRKPIVVPEFGALLSGEPEPRYYRGSVTPLRGAGGEVDRLLLIAVEVTDEMRTRRQVELLAETAESRAQELEAVISNIADAVVITDSQSRAIQANSAYLQLVGAPGPGETSDHRITRFQLRRWDGSTVQPDEMPAVRTIATGRAASADLIATREDGREIYLRVTAAPLRNREGTLSGTVIVLRDLTAFEEAKREKDAFLSLISHELRTPLTIIRGFTQLVGRTLDRSDAGETRRRLEIVQRHVDELTWLVNMLLDMSLVETGQLACQLTWIDYRDVLESLLQEMAGLHPDHQFRFHAPESLWLDGDPERLRQVVTYLVENAIEHGPVGTRVTLTVQEADDKVLTFVCDEGPPLPVSERERIFERFYRVRPQPILNGGSLGLGLFISRAIVEAHGGAMWASDDDHCSFAFSLPRARERQES